MSSANVLADGALGGRAYSAAQTRVIGAAIELFAAHGVGGTSLQMIADAIGVTKAAVYHQYKTKDEIVVAVAEVALARLEAEVAAAESEPSHARAREILVVGMVEFGLESRSLAAVLQRDPIMLRFLQEHAPFRRVMERVNRVLMGAQTDDRARVQAAVLASVIAGSLIHPLAADLDDDRLRAQLGKQIRKLLPQRG